MGDAVQPTVVATGVSEAIAAGVSTFRQRFTNRAMVTIFRAWVVPIWTRRLQIWMPPREDTLR